MKLTLPISMSVARPKVLISLPSMNSNNGMCGLYILWGSSTDTMGNKLIPHTSTDVITSIFL